MQEVDINNIPPEILNNLSPEQISQINDFDLDSSTELEIEAPDSQESLMESDDEQTIVPPEYRKFGFDYFQKYPQQLLQHKICLYHLITKYH